MAFSYKDKTFCNSYCANTQCHRNFSPQVSAEANTWAESIGIDYAPIALSDYSNDCDGYQKPKKGLTTPPRFVKQ